METKKRGGNGGARLQLPPKSPEPNRGVTGGGVAVAHGVERGRPGLTAGLSSSTSSSTFSPTAPRASGGHGSSQSTVRQQGWAGLARGGGIDH